MSLLEEADALFEAAGQPFNGFFYDEVTRLASLPSMETRAEDLRDRVLESIVRKLRKGVEGGHSARGLSRHSWESPSFGRLRWSATPNSRRPPKRSELATAHLLETEIRSSPGRIPMESSPPCARPR